MNKVVPGTFYFVRDDFFTDFPDPMLMQNKETIHGQPHRRPCFFAFEDPKTGLIWLIPISSQITKYRVYQQKKIARYGRCETILFGEVLGHQKAFLIQNMFPVTEQYIANQYMDSLTNAPVKVDGAFEKQLTKTALQVLAKVRIHMKLVFPDILAIEQMLLEKNANRDSE